MAFDFRGTALELCSRPGCCHYRGEHNGPLAAWPSGQASCTGMGRGPDGSMDPSLPHCTCPGFLGEPPEHEHAEGEVCDFTCPRWGWGS